jgi:hypothetical protein
MPANSSKIVNVGIRYQAFYFRIRRVVTGFNITPQVSPFMEQDREAAQRHWI